MNCILRLFLASFETVFKRIVRQYKEEYNESLDKVNYREDPEYTTFYKIVNIALDQYYGSLMCNYYITEFNDGCYDEDELGFQIYDPLQFDDSEEMNICTPIPTFNSGIEQIGNVLLSRVYCEGIGAEEWYRDTVQAEDVLLSLFKSVEYHKKNWVVLSCDIKANEKGKENDLWRDEYLVYSCTSIIGLTGCGDRYLTIEIPYYKGCIDFYHNNYKSDLCHGVYSISREEFMDSSCLVLPPSDIIERLKLKPNYSNMSWVDLNGEEIILCDNTKKSYYEHQIVGLVMMREDAFDKYNSQYGIKFFAFHERLNKENGFDPKLSFHYEIKDKKVIKKYSNKEKDYDDSEKFDQINDCEKCPYNIHERLEKIEKENNITAIDEIEKILSSYTDKNDIVVKESE